MWMKIKAFFKSLFGIKEESLEQRKQKLDKVVEDVKSAQSILGKVIDAVKAKDVSAAKESLKELQSSVKVIKGEAVKAVEQAKADVAYVADQAKAITGEKVKEAVQDAKEAGK